MDAFFETCAVLLAGFALGICASCAVWGLVQ